MSDFADIIALVRGGAEYLARTRLCDEDHLPHGRRSYVWPLLAWMERHGEEGIWLAEAERIAEELDQTVRENQSGETVIFPGLHHRRNYSTNAIDCGTFVDSFYDFAALHRGSPHPLEKKVQAVALTYILKKITGRKDVHDQYLWAATGLARHVRERADDPRAASSRRALEATLDFWLSHHDVHGYSPYMQSDPFMGGLTPYYFSRRIAFAHYIIEQAALRRPDIVETLLTATRFLATLLRPDGTKEMLLEAKRYYFWGSYEADSHPFDIYAFGKAYEKTGDTFWIDAAAASLRALLRAQCPNGAIRSRADEGGVRDWQCDTMRTGHLAWLTRLPEDFLVRIATHSARTLCIPHPFNAPSPHRRVLLVGTPERWIHVVAKKGQLAGHAGERASGILIPTGARVTDLRRPCLFHYRARGSPLRFLRRNRPAIAATFQYAVFHVWDCLVHKRAFGLAWAFLRDGFFGYLFVGLFTRSTEFATELSGLVVRRNSIIHELTLSDVGGHQRVVIGRREIRWDENAVLQIEDRITATSSLRFTLPRGSMNVRGPRTINTTYSLHSRTDT